MRSYHAGISLFKSFPLDRASSISFRDFPELFANLKIAQYQFTPLTALAGI